MTKNHQPAKFLFVNKDAADAQWGSLSRSENDTSSIHRQAQRWTANKARQRRVVALQTESASAKRIARLGWQKREADTEDEVVSGSPITNMHRANITPQRQLQLYSANFSEGGGIDPFAATPTRMNKEVHKLFQYYVSYSILTAFKGEVVGKEHLLQTTEPWPAALVRRSLTSEVHYYSLLAATFSHMNLVTVAGQPSENRYIAPAIGSLRKFLGSLDTKKSIDPQIILDILFLSNAERCRQNDETALTHLRILRQLTQLLDMSIDCHRYVYEMVCDADVFLAVEIATRPLFASSRDPGVIPESRKISIDHELDLALSQQQAAARHGFMGVDVSRSAKFKQRMGVGFLEALDASLFSTEMRGIILDLLQTLDIAMYSSMCFSATEADATWVHKKTMALAHRLMSFQAVDRSAQDRDLLADNAESHVPSLTSCQEECCRLALVIILTYLPSTIASHSVTMNMVRLQRALSGPGSSWGSKIADEVLLWVLITGYFVALDRPEEEWFTGRAVRLASELGIHDHSSLYNTMWRFLHKPYASHEVNLSRLAARLHPNKDSNQPSVMDKTASNQQPALPLRSSCKPSSPP